MTHNVSSGTLDLTHRLLDDVVSRGGAPADWSPRAAALDVNRQRPSTLDDDDYVDDPATVFDKRYMRFGRRSRDDKRYMRFGRAGTHFHPLMGFTKRYMRFGKRWVGSVADH